MFDSRRILIRRNRGARRSRSAFTLLEILLVLAVIVAVIAISYPRLNGMVRQQRMQGVTEEIRRFLDRARVRAIEEGRTLEVRVEANGRHYLLLPHDAVDPEEVASSLRPGAQADAATTRQQDPFLVLRMPEEFHFYLPNAMLGDAPRAERISEQLLDIVQNSYVARDLVWCQPILYFPDGTATDGKVTVMDQNRRYVNLFVRGLTGGVATTPIKVLTESIGVAAP
ncbi:pilus assembly FimT family protein [Planctomicrobium sp. SH664]|uniref:pilus assembly FimT family protein n=1 Tax=Planctomicrobium sp. SH664 TaxID=3448125 RepID=UPI003F5BFE19